MKQSRLVAVIGSTAGLATLGLLGFRIATPTSAQAATDTIDQAVTTTAATMNSVPPMGQRGQAHLDDLAKLLGLTSSQLQTELQSGKPFYQIAAEHGVTYDKLQTAKAAEVKARLDDMVKVGFVTQAQADTMYQQWQTEQQQHLLDLPGMGHGHRFDF